MSANPSEPSRLANTALALGLLSVMGCGCATGLPAWILGARELRNIDSGISPPSGRAFARIAMIIGILYTVTTAIAGLWTFWVFARLVDKLG